MRRRHLLAGILLAATPALAQSPEAVPGTPVTLNDVQVQFVAQAPGDVVFDDTRGITSYGVSVGGFRGLNAKYVALASETLRPSRKDGGTLNAVIGTDKDRRLSAPKDVDLDFEPTEK